MAKSPDISGEIAKASVVDKADVTIAPEAERMYINMVLDELIVSEGVDDIVKAEYLRERGRFEDALELLGNCHPEENFLVDILERMKSYAKKNDSIAFLI